MTTGAAHPRRHRRVRRRPGPEGHQHRRHRRGRRLRPGHDLPALPRGPGRRCWSPPPSSRSPACSRPPAPPPTPRTTSPRRSPPPCTPPPPPSPATPPSSACWPRSPGAVLPFISFDRLGPLLAQAARVGPRAPPPLPRPTTRPRSWGSGCARVVLVHLRSPGSPTDTTDLAAVRRLVEQLPAARPRPARRSPTRHRVSRLTPGATDPCRPTKRSSAAATSTTSRRSSPSPTPTSTSPIHAVKDNADAIFTWDYEKGARPALEQALREGQDLAVERRDRPRLVDRGRPGGRRGRQRASPTAAAEHRLQRHAAREVGRRASGSSSASSRRTGCSASSCTASRAR